MSTESPLPSAGAFRFDPARILAAVLVACTVTAFWPITRWIAGEVAARQQIRQSFIILAAAAGLVAWRHCRELRLQLEIGNRALALLAGSYLCMIAAWAGGIALLALPAFGFALAGCLHVLVGPEAWRFLKPLFTGFIACVGIILLFPLLDWPLRQMAGVNAAHLLKATGFTPQLSVIMQPAPKLLLATGHNVFEVATECNGFGLITTSVVLALLAAGIAGRRARVLLLLMPVAAVLGFVFNLLRIFVICLLAPTFPRHYGALHETAGTLMLWAGLGLVGWLSWRPEVETPAPRPQEK